MITRLVLSAGLLIAVIAAISLAQAPVETTPIMPPAAPPPAQESPAAPLETTPIMPPAAPPPAQEGPAPSPTPARLPDQQTRPLAPVPDQGTVRGAEPLNPLLPGATPAPDIYTTGEPTEPPPGPTRAPDIDTAREPTTLRPGQMTTLPYGQPTAVPYGQPTALPYGQPTAVPYGQPTTLPYGQPTTLPPGQEMLLLEEGQVTGLPEESRRRWRIIPLLSGGVVYDDNIFLSNQDPVADVIWTLSFGGVYELGDFRNQTENYLLAQWIGNPAIYTKNSEQNAFNQYAALTLQYRFNRLVLRLDSRFSHVKGANREVNTITTTTEFRNSLLFRYDYSAKTSFDLTLSQDTSLTEDFQNNSRYEGSAGMNYLIMPETKLGAQGALGVLTSSVDPIQFYQQALARVEYTRLAKLTFTFEAGLQFLEFQGSDKVKIDPIFNLGVQYDPFPGTALVFVGYRNVVSSTTLEGQDFTATGFELRVQQRFLQKFTATVGVGYENDSYFGTTAETPTDRVDNYLFVRPSLTYAFVDWFSASIFFEFRQNTSTQETNGFDNNRAGIDILTRF